MRFNAVYQKLFIVQPLISELIRVLSNYFLFFGNSKAVVSKIQIVYKSYQNVEPSHTFVVKLNLRIIG